MGFWDIAKATGSVAVKLAMATGDRIQKKQAEMQSKSDDELINIIRSSSGSKSFAIHELKNRGYDPEYIKMMAR